MRELKDKNSANNLDAYIEAYYFSLQNFVFPKNWYILIIIDNINVG